MEWLASGLVAAAFYLVWRKRRAKKTKTDNPIDGAVGSMQNPDTRDNAKETRVAREQPQKNSHQ